MYSLCMSCHRLPAVKKIGFRVLCQSCIDARKKAIAKSKAKPKILNDSWDEKRADIISSNGNDGLHY